MSGAGGADSIAASPVFCCSDVKRRLGRRLAPVRNHVMRDIVVFIC